MTNLPPPDPRSSRLGFDELIGVVVAFTVIGTILVVSLRNKDKGFNFTNWFPVFTAPQVSSNPTVNPVPTETVPLPTQTVPPQTAEVTPPLVPIVSPSAPPASPVIRATPEQALKTAPVVPVPVVATSPSPVSAASPTPAKAVNFSDVPADFWARPYIAALAERNIVVGFKDDTFRPNQPVTRAEFAVLLAKAFEQKAVANVPNYKDVPSNFWAAPAIQEATRSGFLQGYPKTVFQPNQHIPRVQTLVALTSGLGLVPNSTPNQGLNNFYQDAGTIPKYATRSVTAATQQSLVVNYPNLKLLNPNQKATRAEVAAMVYQALVQTGKAEAVPSKYVVKP